MSEPMPPTPPLKIRMLQKLMEKAEGATDGTRSTFWMWVVGFVCIAPPGSALDVALQSVLTLIL